MTKKRRIAVLSLSALLMLSAASLGIDSLFPKQEETEEKGGMEITPSNVHGIAFIKSVNSTNSKTCTLTYKLTPEDADQSGFTSTLSWSEKEDANKENDTWLTSDKRPETYVTYSIDTSKKQIVFQSLEAFGYEMEFTMMSNTDSSAKATITINYVRKETSVPTYTLSNDTLENGKEIEIQYTESKWSIGTKGETGTDLPTYELSYYDKTNSGKTFADLIPAVTKNDYYPFYRAEIQYNGTWTDDYASVKEMMTSRSLEYIKSCISPTGVTRTTVDLASFKALMSFNFEFTQNGSVLTSTQSSPFTKFISNYASAYEAGSGLLLTIYYKGAFQKKSLINIKAGNYGVSSIDISATDGNIDF